MKLIFSGGLNKYAPDGYQKSYFYKYTDKINKLIADGKKVCFVTIAKPDHFYDEHLLPQFGEKLDIIGDEAKNVDWSKYDLIFLCGGDTPKLKKGLLAKNFDFNSLKESVIVLGDSAGAMIMAPYFYDSDDRETVHFVEGLYPASKTIVIVHTNNPHYCNDELVNEVEKFAKDKSLKVLKLAECEEKMYDDTTSVFANASLGDLI